MNKIEVWIVGIVAVVALGLSVFALTGGGDDQRAGGLVNVSNPVFVQGLRAGIEQDQIISVDSNSKNPTLSATSTGVHTGDVTGSYSGRTLNHGSTSADVTLTKAQVQASKFYLIDTSGTTTITVTLPEVDTADIGKELEFVIAVASSTNSLDASSTNAVTYASSSLDMAASTTVPTAVGDFIKCRYLTVISVHCLFGVAL